MFPFIIVFSSCKLFRTKILIMATIKTMVTGKPGNNSKNSSTVPMVTLVVIHENHITIST